MTTVLALFALYVLLSTVWLRKKATFLQPVPQSQAKATKKIRLCTTGGYQPSAEDENAVAMFMQQRAIAMLDLWPQGMPAPLALASLARVMTNKMPDEIFMRASSCGVLLAATEEVFLKNSLGERASPPYDPVKLNQLATDLKPCASRSAMSAVMPGLVNPGMSHATQFNVAQDILGEFLALYLAGRLLVPLLFIMGLAWSLPAALATLVLFSLQPIFVFAGGALRPRGLWSYSIFRIFTDLWLTGVMIYHAVRHARDNERRALRAEYSAIMSRGVSRFLLPREQKCPLCQNENLAVFLRSGDYQQNKPGLFTLEICRSCGHIFQNPRVSFEGLDFYYKDFYSGIGRTRAELAFSFNLPKYLARAQIIARHTTPKLWLDVGFGQGHFCQMARFVLPQTSFHGADMNDNVVEALRRGWIDQGFVGMFPEIAPQLAGLYDVVSMHHYLEHAPDIRAELSAAHKVVTASGYLVIELPNPDCLLSRLLRGFCFDWFQPQHLHFLTIKNTKKLLAEAGFAVIETQSYQAHQSHQLVIALLTMKRRFAPPPNLPWLDRKWYSSLRSWLGLILITPLFLPTLLLGSLYDRCVHTDRWSNTFRILAKKSAELNID